MVTERESERKRERERERERGGGRERETERERKRERYEMHQIEQGKKTYGQLIKLIQRIECMIYFLLIHKYTRVIV